MFFGNLKLISHATLKFLLLQLLLLIIYLLVRNILVAIPCRIRKGVPSEARVVARVLPPLLLDFFPVQEIMNKVIGEFLSSQQPHPELMAQIIFKVSEVLCFCSVEPIKVSLSQNSFSLLFTFKTGAFLHLRLFWSSVATDLFVILYSHLFFNRNISVHSWTCPSLIIGPLKQTMSAPLPPLIRDGPSKKLWKERERGQVVEGGGAFRSTKKKSIRTWICKWKKLCTAKGAKNICFCIGCKKYSCKRYINGKKKFIQLENSLPLPPNSFLVVGPFAGW